MQIKWRSYYRDNDLGFYYIKGRYYDEESGNFLDADDAEDVLDNAEEPGWLDRNEMAADGYAHVYANDDTIFTSSELSVDVTYDENEGKSWWELHWLEFIQWSAFAVAAATSVALACLGHPGMLLCCVKAAVLGAISGAVLCGAMTFFTGGSLEDTVSAMKKGAIDGFRDAFTVAAISYGISAISRALSTNRAKRAVCSRKGQCFIAGTLVLTAAGYKAIEDIQIGDMVLAYDEETGETAYKPVVRLFRNESKDWTGVTVNGLEIVSTPGHKYFLPETKEWVSAEDLKVGTKVLLSDGSYGIIEAVRAIHYDEPQTTYNFEVVGFHTYYVGNGVCVHNMNGLPCSGKKEVRTGKTKNYSVHESKRAAYRAAKRDAGVVSNQPTKVSAATNRYGHRIPGKTYSFGEKQILWHSAGHPEYGMTRHFNFGNKHYFY